MRMNHRMSGMRYRQRGVTLFLAMIVLVAMLLSGVALFRTVDTGVLVAGNVAMQKGATRQGDQGTEDAVLWLTTALPSDLYDNQPGHGYVANAINDQPAGTQTWADWWAIYANTHAPVTLSLDSQTGNTVSYFVQRLCSAIGAPYTAAVTCVGPPESSSLGGSKGFAVKLQRATAVYYRITSRITGPRNTVSYVQTVISL